MIHCGKINRLLNLSFDNYILLPHKSYSFLKQERNGFAAPIKKTNKILLGSLVDSILTNGPVDMLDPLYRHAKPIAAVLKAEFSWLLPHLDKQVSYTAEMQFGEFKLSVKGRPDFELPKTITIDLKVTHEKDIDAWIKFMGYKDQQYGYAKMGQTKESYLLISSTKHKLPIVKRLDISGSNKFWEEKILKFGSV